MNPLREVPVPVLDVSTIEVDSNGCGMPKILGGKLLLENQQDAPT
jgi:hypothetical protein